MANKTYCDTCGKEIIGVGSRVSSVYKTYRSLPRTTLTEVERMVGVLEHVGFNVNVEVDNSLGSDVCRECKTKVAVNALKQWCMMGIEEES